METKDENIVAVIAKSGKQYLLNRETFAALSTDAANPLYCVSLANSSYSIDLWRGCKYKCAYCHVQGCMSDYRNGTIYYSPVKRNNSTEEDVVRALIEYRSFEKDRGIISINTSSTEPFGNKEVTDSTISVIESLAKYGCRNPIWIVTKGGMINKGQIDRLKKVVENGARVIISICWTNNLAAIEPVRINRFEFAEELNQIGIHVNWYMRPLVREWNASQENLEFIMKYVSENKFPIKSIVAGGLRWTSGIEYGLTEINNIALPQLVKDENTKTLDKELVDMIITYHKKYLNEIPLFFKSSCCLAYALETPCASMVDIFEQEFCRMSHCKDRQKKRCSTRKISNIDQINKSIIKYGYKIEKTNDNWKLESTILKNTYENGILARKYIKNMIS